MALALHSHSMRRRPSLSLRAFRGLVVLVTVWCTGCTGFEPLIDAALGRTEMGMACASEAGTGADGSQTSSARAVEGPHFASTVSALATSPAQAGFSCGCASCLAVTPVVLSFAHLPPPLAPVAAPELPLASVARVPLLPPPERSVA
jgi:hypothetical protein